jgi:hypothetical protein
VEAVVLQNLPIKVLHNITGEIAATQVLDEASSEHSTSGLSLIEILLRQGAKSLPLVGREISPLFPNQPAQDQEHSAIGEGTVIFAMVNSIGNPVVPKLREYVDTAVKRFLAGFHLRRH